MTCGTTCFHPAPDPLQRDLGVDEDSSSRGASRWFLREIKSHRFPSSREALDVNRASLIASYPKLAGMVYSLGTYLGRNPETAYSPEGIRPGSTRGWFLVERQICPFPPKPDQAYKRSGPCPAKPTLQASVLVRIQSPLPSIRGVAQSGRAAASRAVLKSTPGCPLGHGPRFSGRFQQTGVGTPTRFGGHLPPEGVLLFLLRGLLRWPPGGSDRCRGRPPESKAMLTSGCALMSRPARSTSSSVTGSGTSTSTPSSKDRLRGLRSAS